MKEIVLLLSLILAAPVFGFEGDHVAHFWSSSLYGLLADTVTYRYAETMGPAQRMATSFGIGLVPGLAWEIKDGFEKNNHFAWDDLTADALGVLTGVAAAELINGQLWISASGKQIRLVGKW